MPRYDSPETFKTMATDGLPKDPVRRAAILELENAGIVPEPEEMPDKDFLALAFDRDILLLEFMRLLYDDERFSFTGKIDFEKVGCTEGDFLQWHRANEESIELERKNKLRCLLKKLTPGERKLLGYKEEEPE